MNQDPQGAGGHPVACGIHRRDAVKMDRAFGVLLDDLEFRVFHHNLIAPDFWFSKDDNLLVAGDHFLHPRHVEPPANERRSQHPGRFVLDSCFKNPPGSEPPVNRFPHDAKKADRLLRSLIRKTVELDAVFVSAREMFQQVTEGLQAESAQRRQTRAGHPLQILEFCCRGKPAHSDLRTPTIRIWASVRPCQQFQSSV